MKTVLCLWGKETVNRGDVSRIRLDNTTPEAPPKSDFQGFISIMRLLGLFKTRVLQPSPDF